MGADAAVAITVEGGRIAAVAAVAFTCDQIHELRFLSLLHKLPHSGSSLVSRGSGLGRGHNVPIGAWGFRRRSLKRRTISEV